MKVLFRLMADGNGPRDQLDSGLRRLVRPAKGSKIVWSGEIETFAARRARFAHIGFE